MAEPVSVRRGVEAGVELRGPCRQGGCGAADTGVTWVTSSPMGNPLFGFEIDVSESHYVAPQAVPAEFRTLVAPVLFQSRESGSWECRGTSFCIFAPTTHAQAVFITACHVVDPLVDSLRADPYLLIPRSTSPDCALHLVGVPVDAISLAQSHNDIALLRIDLRKAGEPIESQFASAVIELRPPEIGENTLAWGYPHQEVTESLNFVSELRASHGIVEAVHHERRDSILVTFPSFMVSGRYEPGMSGGPVYGEKGGVIGVVSRGMTPTDGSPPYGVAVSIGCLTELRMSLQTDDGEPFEYSVPELSSIGLIKLQCDYGVTLDRNESGLELKWVTVPPSGTGDSSRSD